MKDESEVSQVSWRDLEKPETYFVNDKVTKYGVLKTNSKLAGVMASTLKGLTLVVPLIILFAISAVTVMTLGFWIMLLLDIAGLTLYGIIVNRIVFHSAKNARLLADQQKIGVYGVSRWNDVIVDKESGHIFNTTGGQNGIRSSFLVTWDNAPILDNSMQAEQLVVDNELTPFITELHKLGMSYDKRNIEYRNDQSQSLLNTIVKTRNLNDNPAVQVKMNLQNRVYSAIEMYSQQQYRTVIQVKSDARGKLFNFKNSLESVIESTIGSSSLMKNAHIMSFDEVQEYARNESRDFSLNLNELGRNNNSMQIFKYVDILTIIGENGREYNYSDLVRGGNSSFDSMEDGALPKRRESNGKSQRDRMRNTKLPERRQSTPHKQTPRPDRENDGDWRSVDGNFLDDL